MDIVVFRSPRRNLESVATSRHCRRTPSASAPWFEESAPQIDGRIVGGQDADIEDYPYQLSLLYLGEHFCGASIISDKWVITAGHCMESMTADVLSVRAGSSILESGGQVVNVKEIHQHPNFTYQTIDYDMALLELTESINMTNSSSPIELVGRNAKFISGAEAIITGWGTLNEGDTVLPEHLQVAKVPLVNKTACRGYYGDKYITDRMLCAGVVGKDSCQGDSGGPLVVNGKLAGIVSWGYGCAEPRLPGVYTNVASMRGFVTEITGI